jgi:hypothetical protein
VFLRFKKFPSFVHVAFTGFGEDDVGGKALVETVAQSRRDTQAELTDLVRSRTELECIVEDLRAANQNAGGRREDYEAELEQIEQKIAEKEASLES